MLKIIGLIVFAIIVMFAINFIAFVIYLKAIYHYMKKNQCLQEKENEMLMKMYMIFN